MALVKRGPTGLQRPSSAGATNSTGFEREMTGKSSTDCLLCWYRQLVHRIYADTYLPQPRDTFTHTVLCITRANKTATRCAVHCSHTIRVMRRRDVLHPMSKLESCRAVEVEVERDEYVAALEAAKKQGKNQFKQLKKLRQLVQRMPPSHPSRPDALLQLSLSILDLHDSSQHKTEAYELGIAAVEAAPEGSRVWVEAMCMAWQDCQHAVVKMADRPSWWTVDELRRRAKLCCRADGMAALAWSFQGDMLDGSSRTALPRGLTFDRIPTPAEKRAAATCYTKAAMCADGPEKYLTHPSSLGAKMMRMAGRLQMIAKNMEDPEHALVMRTELQKMLDERNEELAAMTDNRDYSGDWRDLVRER